MNRPLPAWRLWFNGRAATSRLPLEAIQDCSAQGDEWAPGPHIPANAGVRYLPANLPVLQVQV